MRGKLRELDQREKHRRTRGDTGRAMVRADRVPSWVMRGMPRLSQGEFERLVRGSEPRERVKE